MVTQLEANYDLAAAFLTEWFPEGVSDLADVAQHYTGGRSLYYADLLAQALTRIEPGIRLKLAGALG